MVALDWKRLAYWYFRLNGFLTIPNFIVHPDRGKGIKTDIDILGVRFPCRRELLGNNPMVDDGVFTKINDRPFIALVEVKRGRVDVNEAWSDPQRMNAERFLGLLGTWQSERVEEIAQMIYEKGWYSDALGYISWVLVGGEGNVDITRRYPDVLRICWDRIGGFIYDRLHDYEPQKSYHDQWDESGYQLWHVYWGNRDNRQHFIDALKHECGITTHHP